MSLRATQVAARLRPFDVHADYLSVGVTANGDTELYAEDGSVEKCFEMDFSFGHDTDNSEVYRQLIDPLVVRALRGFNATAIMFGASQTGKAHAVFGDEFEAGLIQMAAHALFEKVQIDSNSHFLVTLSAYQLRGDTITDLLCPASPSHLGVIDDPRFDSRVDGLVELVVRDLQEVEELVLQAQKVLFELLQRDGAPGKPHFVFELHVESRANSNLTAPITYSVLRFAALAGSGGMAMKMDRHLRSFEDCVQRLAAQNDVWTVPYNESALMRLLKQSVGGNSTTVFVACVAPLGEFQEDTMRTLELAKQVKEVSNTPTRNQNTVNDTLQHLRSEIRKARSELNLDHPGNYMHEIDPSKIEQLQGLLRQLEVAKKQTWEARIEASRQAMEQRKTALSELDMFLFLEEEVEQDHEVMRDMQSQRRDLVNQTKIIDKVDTELNALEVRFEEIDQLLAGAEESERLTQMVLAIEEELAQDSGNAELEAQLEQARSQQKEFAVAEMSPEDREAHANELAELEAEVKTKKKELKKQRRKMLKLRAKFRSTMEKLVETEERNRKTFLTAPESSALNARRDHMEWDHLVATKGTDPMLRDKIAKLEEESNERLAALQEQEVTLEMLQQAEEERHRAMFLFTEAHWERDELLARIFERDVRHELQLARVQQQMFVVFREYRRHFDEQRKKMDARYRKLVEDAVHDALQLSRRNQQLEARVHQLESQVGRDNHQHQVEDEAEL